MHTGVRILQQIVDENAHTLDAVDDQGDKFVGLGIVRIAIAADQQLSEAGDGAERLLQIVTGYIGELPEFFIGPLERLTGDLEPAPFPFRRRKQPGVIDRDGGLGCQAGDDALFAARKSNASLRWPNNRTPTTVLRREKKRARRYSCRATAFLQ